LWIEISNYSRVEIVVTVVLALWGLVILLDIFNDGFKDSLIKLILLALGFAFLYFMATYGSWSIGSEI